VWRVSEGGNSLNERFLSLYSTGRRGERKKREGNRTDVVASSFNITRPRSKEKGKREKERKRSDFQRSKTGRSCIKKLLTLSPRGWRSRRKGREKEGVREEVRAKKRKGHFTITGNGQTGSFFLPTGKGIRKKKEGKKGGGGGERKKVGKGPKRAVA